MKIIGIGGTNGSGKDTLARFVVEEHDYLLVSISDILRAELKRRGLAIERENLRALSAEWRKERGLGVLVDLAVEEFESHSSTYAGLVIPSLRNPGEVDEVHRLGGKVVWIDGDPKVRYQRINSRARSTEDQKTYEQFLAEEKAEMDYGGDETALHMAGVKAKADIYITNDFNNLEDFQKAAEKALNL